MSTHISRYLHHVGRAFRMIGQPCLIIFCAALWCLPNFPLYSEETTLKPRNVVISSTYQETLELPEIQHNTFDLQYPADLKEPYTPDFELPHYPLPEIFPDNIVMGWLPGLSTTLASIFWGEEGKLRAGVSLYKSGKYEEAARLFTTLYETSTETREIAMLWAAWSYFKAGQPDRSTQLTHFLNTSPNIELILESVYLDALIFYKKGSYSDAVRVLDRFGGRIPREKWQPRTIRAYIYSLAALEKWEPLSRVFEEIDYQRFSYISAYDHLIQIAVISALKTEQYRIGIEHTSRLLSTNDHPVFQTKAKRLLSWLYYYAGNYTQAITTIESISERIQGFDTTERLYLKTSAYIRLRQWDKVQTYIQEIPSNDPFHHYISYQARTLMDTPQNHPKLIKLLSIENITYPDMRFHIGLLEGNRWFETQDFQSASKQFFKAASTDTNSSDYWKSYYNLGLSHLKQKQYPAARENFKLVHEGYEKSATLAKTTYHLVYALYQTREYEQCLNSLRHDTGDGLTEGEKYEVALIQAMCQLGLGQSEVARERLLELWESSGQTAPLELAVQSYYHDGLFQSVDQTIRADLVTASSTLTAYKIKALLALGNYSQAEQLLAQNDVNQTSYPSLRLEVLAANQRYDEIVEIVTGKLRQMPDRETRLANYLILGDAYYNLKMFGKSKNQFYKALQLSNDPKTEELILYNIILTSFYEGEFVSFLNETKAFLNRPSIPDEIRFNLTVLLSDYYGNKKQTDQFDTLLTTYIKTYAYKNATMRLKQVRYYFKNKDMGKCYTYASQPTLSEDKYQKIDRLVLQAYCANTSGRKIVVINRLNDDPDIAGFSYREDEIIFLKAKLYESTGQFSAAIQTAKSLEGKTLLPDIRLETDLILARGFFAEGHPQEAKEVIGEVIRFRQSDFYGTALRVSAEISFSQNRLNEGIRGYLRLYYFPMTSAIEKEAVLVRIVEILVERDLFQKAKGVFEKINPATFGDDQEMVKTYDTLKRRIQAQNAA